MTSFLAGRPRTIASMLARVGTVLSAGMLTVGVVGLAPSDAAAAPLNPGAPPAGGIVMNPPTGNSDTNFGLSFPTAQVCPGNGSVDGYRWHSFIAPSGADVAAFTWSAAGAPTGPGFKYNLYDEGGTGVRNQFPADSPAGAVTNIPGNIQLAGGGVFGPAGIPIPAGSYIVGIACVKVTDNVGRTEKFWSTEVAITANVAAGGVAQVTFAPGTPTATTTTTTVAGTTTTTVVGATTTTTTTVAGATTTTVAGATTTTVVGGAAQAATLTPAVPTAGAPYKVTHPNCRVGDTITVTQPQSTPTSATATCALPVAGGDRPEQAAIGTATVTFTAAPTTPGTYTVTSTGATSGTRTATFVIVGVTSTTLASTGGNPLGGSTGSIPATGSSTTSIIVWGALLLVFGRMAILFGRKPKVISANR